MAQTTLILDSGFITDLHSAGGFDALASQYDSIRIPAEVVERVARDPEVAEAFTDWQAANSDTVSIIPTVSAESMAAFYPDYSAVSHMHDSADTASFAIRHAAHTVLDEGGTPVIAATDADMITLARDDVGAESINGVHTYLDDRLAAGEMTVLEHLQGRVGLMEAPIRRDSSELTPGVDAPLGRDLVARNADAFEIEVMLHPATRGFYADADNTRQVFLNTELRAVVEATPDSMSTTHFETPTEAAHHYGQEKMEAFRDDPAAFSGSLPINITGTTVTVSSFYTSVVDPTFAERMMRGGSEAGEHIGRATKLLGPVGGAFAANEVSGLLDTMNELIEEGLLTETASYAYAAVYGGHIGQATFDPSGIGGEVPIQAAFDAAGAANQVDCAVHDMLEPGSLIEAAAGAGGVDLDIYCNGWRTELSGDAAEAAGTPMREVRDYLNADELALRPDPDTMETAHPIHNTMISQETAETLTTLVQEDVSHLPVEVDAEMSPADRTRTLLEGANTAYADLGHEPIIELPEARVPPVREDVAEDYEYGAH